MAAWGPEDESVVHGEVVAGSETKQLRFYHSLLNDRETGIPRCRVTVLDCIGMGACGVMAAIRPRLIDLEARAVSLPSRGPGVVGVVRQPTGTKGSPVKHLT